MTLASGDRFSRRAVERIWRNGRVGRRHHRHIQGSRYQYRANTQRR
jgi:hypothetical protein